MNCESEEIEKYVCIEFPLENVKTTHKMSHSNFLFSSVKQDKFIKRENRYICVYVCAKKRELHAQVCTYISDKMIEEIHNKKQKIQFHSRYFQITKTTVIFTQ